MFPIELGDSNRFFKCKINNKTEVIYIPIIPPRHMNAAIHDASSIVILPDANGVSSDIKIKKFGLVQPHVTP